MEFIPHGHSAFGKSAPSAGSTDVEEDGLLCRGGGEVSLEQMNQDESIWSDLPSELLRVVMRHLPTGVLLTTVRQVCSRWKAEAETLPYLYLSPIHIPHWGSKRLGQGLGAAAHHAPLDRLIRCRSSWLHALSVAESDAVKPKVTAAAVATALQLSSLDMTYTEVLDEDINLIATHCTKLEVIKLSRCEALTDASLVALQHCSLLQRLSVSQCLMVTGGGVARLFASPNQLPQMTVLELAGITTLTDKELEGIAQGCKLLRVLDVARCSGVGDASCISIGSNCKLLQVINLSHTSVTDHGLERLTQGCPLLQELHLVHCPSIKAPPQRLATGGDGLKLLNISQISGITAASIVQLATDHPALVNLSLCGGLGLGAVRRRGPEISATAVRALATMCRALKIVDLSWQTDLQNDWLAELNPATQLTSVDLSVTPVQTAGLASLSEACQGLKILKLADCAGVTDAGLKYVASKCTLLEVLDVSECAGVTDAGLRYIAFGCNLLLSLDASDCEQVTDAGIISILQNCVKLCQLKVAETEVTDAILIEAERRPLEIVDVHQCDSLSSEAMLRFVSRMCSILRVLNIYYCRKLPVAIRDLLVATYPTLTVHHQGSTA